MKSLHTMPGQSASRYKWPGKRKASVLRGVRAFRARKPWYDQLERLKRSLKKAGVPSHLPPDEVGALWQLEASEKVPGHRWKLCRRDPEQAWVIDNVTFRLVPRLQRHSKESKQQRTWRRCLRILQEG